jgi:NAD(P)-dependent dehydrogenase (short-subunit alcohol dehydrogenase family)
MSSPNNQAWFISGANRGIGFELVKQLASRTDTIVFAAARTPSKAKDLNDFAHSHTNVHIVKLESVSEADATAAAKSVEKIAGGLDGVIANAGIAQNWQHAVDADIEAMKEHYLVNVGGPLILFKALYPLLLKRQTRKFITVSSLAGVIGDILAPPMTIYGSSKAALNYVTKSIHKEQSPNGFVVFPIHPGMVDTDMAKPVSKEIFGLEKFPVSPEDSARSILEVVDRAGAAESGRFWSYTGEELTW